VRRHAAAWLLLALLAALVPARFAHAQVVPTTPRSVDHGLADPRSPVPGGSGGGLPVYNVQAAPYSAVGNGIHDDTTALQGAITALCQAGGGVVFLPKGIYKITAALNIACSNFTLWGTGMQSSVILQATAGANGLQNSSGVNYAYQNYRDFGLLCQSGVQCGTAINWLDIRDSVLENVKVGAANPATDGFLIGINIETTLADNGSYRLQLNNPVVTTVDNASAMALRLTGVGVNDGATSLKVYGGTLRADHGTGVWLNKGNNFLFSSIVFEGGTSIGIDVVGVAGQGLGVLIEACRFENKLNNPATGILLETNSQGVTTSNNLWGGVTNTVTNNGTRNCVWEPQYEAGQHLACSGTVDLTTGGTVQGTTVRAGDGNVTNAPGITFANNTTSGFSRSSSDAVFLSITGTQRLKFFPGTVTNFHTSGVLGWASSGTDNGDIYLGRSGPGTLRLGLSETAQPPTSHTVSVQHASGTDTNGAPFTIVGSRATGAGVPGRLHLQGSAVSPTSGSSLNSAIDRLIVGATKVLTNNTDTGLLTLTLATDSAEAVLIDYHVEAVDTTNHKMQTEVGQVICNVANENGTVSGNVCTKLGNQQYVGANALTVTWTTTAATPSVVTINSNSTLAALASGYPRVTYSVRHLGQQAVSVQ
jgi:hypothetical protein